ncbi:zinc finger protein 830-like [Haliotis rufescens]|uniref:zinc finger protein 830-like n=1 Tax=Haliotis rufescens TaxID=6454 RepID=UPI00201ED010|nr:zinc finger protein 830-like [Haliotis rufescens]
MASSKKKKIVSKDELRRLMKQKQTTLKSSNRVEHAHAKYNSLNQLVCTVCNITIKSDLLWAAHIQSRSHKEYVAAKAVVGPPLPATIKRTSSHTDSGASQSKKLKSQNGSSAKQTGLPADFFDKSSTKSQQQTNSLLADYGSSSEEDSDDRTSSTAKPGVTGLPTDFFDKGSKPSGDAVEEKPKTMADILPEGFFDDPKMDAKVRKVEYKDKMEEEWEQFRRAMKEESHVSENIIEEDDQQANIERNIDEIDDQMNRWKEIEDLHDKKAEVIGKVGDRETQSDSEGEVDEAELEELFDWRAKKTWK